MNRKEKTLEDYLVTAARMGERDAFQKLVILRSPRLMAHAVRLLGEVEGDGPDAVDRARLRAAIASLPPDQAATIALFYLEEMSVAEVVIATDVPIGTVKTRLMHARAKLRAILEGENHGKT